MDPISALSLACNIIQIVQYGVATAKLTWEVLHSSSGASVENESIEERTKTLRELVSSLRTSQQLGERHVQQGTGFEETAQAQCQQQAKVKEIKTMTITLTTRDMLEETALRCDKKATELIEVLTSIKISNNDTHLTKFGKIFKLFKKKNKVKSLKEHLEVLKRDVELHVVGDVRKTCENMYAGQMEGFQQLDVSCRAIVAAIARHKTYLQEIIETSSQMMTSVVQDDGARTRDEVTKVRRTIEQAELSAHERELIESFKFDGMFARQESISPAARNTYQWIFDGNDDAPWDSLAEWMEHDDPFYWISGKAGSGKSTLMTYIWGERREDKDRYLGRWAGQDKLVTAAVFFWNLGSDVQKSIGGLLRSLIYQDIFQLLSCVLLLRSHRVPDVYLTDIDDKFIPADIKMIVLRNLPETLSALDQNTIKPIISATPWIESNLKSILLAILAQVRVKLCFFIDGLDEFGDATPAAHEELTLFIQSLVHHARGRLKCCISSRPLKVFEDTFSNSAKLAMQELTKRDIEEYVRQKLGKEDKPTLNREIVGMAQGVFLWVKLVVSNLTAGKIAEDSETRLLKKLRAFPKGLEALFKHMYELIDNNDRDEAASYFAMANPRPVPCRNMSVCEVVLGTEHRYAKLFSNQLTPQEIKVLREDCQQKETRIKNCCAGLIEISTGGYRGLTPSMISHDSRHNHSTSPISRDQDTIQDLLFGRSLRLLHRTVQEFLCRYCVLPPAEDIYHAQLHSMVQVLLLQDSLGVSLKRSGRLDKLCVEAIEIEHMLQRETGRLRIRHLQKLCQGASNFLGEYWSEFRDRNFFGKSFPELCAEFCHTAYIQDLISKAWDHHVLGDKQEALDRLLLSTTSRGFLGSSTASNKCRCQLYSQHCNIISVLLDYGANPTTKASPESTSQTAWIGFLGMVVSRTIAYTLDFFISTSILPLSCDLKDLTKKLLARGVDVDQYSVFEMFYFAKIGAGYLKGCYYIRMSARFILQIAGLIEDFDVPASDEAVIVSGWSVKVESNLSQNQISRYDLTPEGSDYLLESLLPLWKKQPWNKKPSEVVVVESLKKFQALHRSSERSRATQNPFLSNVSRDHDDTPVQRTVRRMPFGASTVTRILPVQERYYDLRSIPRYLDESGDDSLSE